MYLQIVVAEDSSLNPWPGLRVEKVWLGVSVGRVESPGQVNLETMEYDKGRGTS